MILATREIVMLPWSHDVHCIQRLQINLFRITMGAGLESWASRDHDTSHEDTDLDIEEILF